MEDNGLKEQTLTLLRDLVERIEGGMLLINWAGVEMKSTLGLVDGWDGMVAGAPTGGRFLVLSLHVTDSAQAARFEEWYSEQQREGLPTLAPRFA